MHLLSWVLKNRTLKIIFFLPKYSLYDAYLVLHDYFLLLILPLYTHFNMYNYLFSNYKETLSDK